MKLEITDDRVREAAESCPDAKGVLTKLFPSVFLHKVSPIILDNGAPTRGLIYENFKRQLFYLTPYPANSVEGKIKWELRERAGAGWDLIPTYEK